MTKRAWFYVLVLALLLAAVPMALADSAIIQAPDLMTFAAGQLSLTQTDTSRDFMAKYILEGEAEAVTRVMDEYVALLDGCGDVTPDSRFPLGPGRRIVAYTCEAAGVKSFTVSNDSEGWSVKSVSLCIEQTSSTSLTLRVATGLSFQNNGNGTRASVYANGTATVGATAGMPQLPDPYYFFQGKFRHSEDHGIQMSFSATGLDAVNEYIALLQSGKFQLKLRDSRNKPFRPYGGDTYYIFDYTGGQTMTGGQMEIDGTTENAAVIVWVHDLTGLLNGNGFVSFTIVADNAFTYVDDGSRVSYTSYADYKDDYQPCAPYRQGTIAPSGGPAGSFDVPSSGTRDDICHYCGGDGIDRACLQCGGDGIMDASRKRCSACGGTGNHRCNFCGGTGRR